MTTTKDHPLTGMSPRSLTVDDVIFTEATPHQRTLSWQLNAASWAPPVMSIEQYVGREHLLSETTLSRDGGTRYYILHSKDDPETIISSCEVTSKKVFIATPGSDGPGEVVQPEKAYAIASVFTNPLYRGRGMASYMLKRVQEIVDGQDGMECGVLYSDIGREYYTRLGWKDHKSPQLVFEILEGHDAGHDNFPRGLEMLRVQQEGEIEELCEQDVKMLRNRFSLLASLVTSRKDKTHVAFLPDWEQMSWHFAKVDYMAKLMGNGREVVNRGARTNDGKNWILWDHDLRGNKLQVLRLVLSEESTDDEKKKGEDVKLLLSAALKEAVEWELKKVVIWQPLALLSMAAVLLWGENPKFKLTFEQREDGSIPSLRWKCGEKMETVWEDNEYYAWC
ncbi:hypothetical protein QBC43DRAFT_317306 [Cladorrhinum sp. PSN259]|nr:hypothetical protein QBC43DRAFT_317306 [Cladorrhinum sp. PSN259]